MNFPNFLRKKTRQICVIFVLCHMIFEGVIRRCRLYKTTITTPIQYTQLFCIECSRSEGVEHVFELHGVIKTILVSMIVVV